ncbi:MAG: methyltransferase domain-containing protein [Beijerinckiaceae bacterium]|nr:methyltransferase domain-containing protein [Beijerinckiaceae bacterium]
MRTQNKKPGAGNKSRIALAFQERFADEARFIRAWFENPVATGAVSPSGRFLSRAMARYVNAASDGPVVELGPGTGPVTQALLERGLDPSRLILVEYDPAFCRLLERRFPGVRVVQGDAYNLRDTLAGVLDAPAAAIVSSLPLLNRPDPDRVALLADAFELLSPTGVFVQFTYGMLSPIPRRGSEGVCYTAEASQPVWLNLPPARVWCYRPASAPTPRRANVAQRLVFNIKKHTNRVRDEILETRDRLGTEIRLAKDRVRIDIAGRGTRVRDEVRDNPALGMIRKLGERRDR